MNSTKSVANYKLMFIYETLLAHYGNLNWWPAETPYEVMVGAILTQNTAWRNVEKALSNLNNLSPEFILDSNLADLAEIIRPAGFFNQKAAFLKAVTTWFAKYNFDVTEIQKQQLEKVRKDLLAVKGVGRETADSILLYAFGFPTFVIDAYTARLCERIPITTEKKYDSLKKYFEDNLSKNTDVYKNFHAMIVINAKNHCRKKPICINCPLGNICEKIAPI